MSYIREQKVNCPYCGESFTVLIDPSDEGQAYIEDCQVCCRPMTLIITSDQDGDICVAVHGENDIH